jgi:uncharacterized membrane protein
MVATIGREHAVHDVKIRQISPRDLRAALSEGWSDFADKRGDILFIAVVYPAVMLIASAAALNQNLIPIVFPVLAGLTLLGPAVASGFYEIARRRECGDDPSWRHFLDVVRSDAIVPLGELTALLLGIFILWLWAAWEIYAATLGPEPPSSIAAFANDLFTTREGWQLILFGNLAGFLFAVLTLTISVVSFPMVVDRHVSAATALETSVRAVWQNPGTMMLWGLIVAALLFLGSIPAFVGLMVVLPLLGYATWHVYRHTIE